MQYEDDLYFLRFGLAGWNLEQAAKLCGVTTKTFENWEKGRAKVPAFVFPLIRAYGAGYIPSTSKDWRGWRIIKNELWLPENISYSAGDIRSIFFLRQLITQQQRILAAHSNEQLWLDFKAA